MSPALPVRFAFVALVALSASCALGCDSTKSAPDSADTAAPDPTDTADTIAPDTADIADAQDAVDDTTPDTTVADTASAPGYSLSLGGWTLQPSEETTRCVIVRLGNTDKIWVPRIHTSLAKGSHHFVVYRTNDTVERKDPFDCAPFSETLSGNTVPLMITQVRDETIELPPGVAFELEPNQMLRLEAHYLNYYTEPITAQADVHFDVLPPDDPPLVADFMFYGTTFFYLPKGQKVTTPWVYYQVPEGLQIFAMTGHTHRLGTNVEVDFATSASDGQSVYPPDGRPFQWSDAPVAFFDPPLTIGPSQGFRFRCTWDNTTDSDVIFGESATAEMCFFWAYYYPTRGFLVRF